MVNKLQIVRVDNLSVQRVDLQIGKNIIGRGAATGHVDNPIAEHAVTIDLEPTGEMTITPMLACYMKHGNSTSWQSLKIGATVKIELGDICSLLPDKSWFKITSAESLTIMENDSGKRKATESSTEEPPDKKPRTSDSVETIYSQSKSVLEGWDAEGASNVQECDKPISLSAQPGNIAKDTSDSRDENSASAPNEEDPSIRDASNDREDVAIAGGKNLAANDSSTRANPENASADGSAGKEAQGQSRDEAGKKIKWDCGRHFSDQTEQGSGGATTAEATSDDTSTRQETNPTAEATVSSDEPLRNKCAYGTRCYRRNPEHKRQFSHPGDPDYDIPDPRPECPYGVRCYRKNPQHKRDFKHTNNRPSRAQTPIRGRASNTTSCTEQSSAEESVDESDYEPSYYDATSDEYRSDFDGLSDCEVISDGEDDK